ncbi:MAG: HPr family phosphocarrier protein [Endomicrobium sp.]|jgi:phosphocarrier protein|nr:HPr family phosphocarrier protein [Endomicrobium sp.]
MCETMKEKIIVVPNKMGLHARPAMMLVQITNKYQATIKIIKDDFEVNAKSIMGIMTLAAAQGTELKFVAEGFDEIDVLAAVERLFNSNFGE